jgi:predicted methyltransferase
VLDGVPANCCDLVTINQGLHHLPPASLPLFLRGVRRMLRPGGLFIVREHDATPELVS